MMYTFKVNKILLFLGKEAKHIFRKPLYMKIMLKSLNHILVQ